MKINLDRYLEQELSLMVRIFKDTGDWEQIDVHAFESKIEFGGKKIIIVFYPELLSYGYVWHEGVGVYDDSRNKRSEEVTTPWIACRIELEGEHDTAWHSKVLSALKKWLEEKIEIKPFYDEDASHGIYSRQCSAYIRDWTKYIFYMNFDYPNGWWENHTLT